MSDITLPESLTPMQALELLHKLTGCKAIAMDSTNDWYVSIEVPFLNEPHGLFSGGSDYLQVTHPITYDGDWRDSLHVIGKGQVKRKGGVE